MIYGLKVTSRVDKYCENRKINLMKLRPVNENEIFRPNYYHRVQFKMEIS